MKADNSKLITLPGSPALIWARSFNDQPEMKLSQEDVKWEHDAVPRGKAKAHKRPA